MTSLPHRTGNLFCLCAPINALSLFASWSRIFPPLCGVFSCFHSCFALCQVHDEHELGKVRPVWESVAASTIQTSAEVRVGLFCVCWSPLPVVRGMCLVHACLLFCNFCCNPCALV